MHKQITRPALTDGDVLAKAAHDLIAALKRRQNWLGDEQCHDLESLADVFQEAASGKNASPVLSLWPQQQKEMPSSLRVAPPRVADIVYDGHDMKPLNDTPEPASTGQFK